MHRQYIKALIRRKCIQHLVWNYKLVLLFTLFMLTYFTYNWSVGLIYNNVYVHVYERAMDPWIIHCFDCILDVQGRFKIRTRPSKKKVQDFICVRQTLTRFLYPKKVNSNADQSSCCPVLFQERFQLQFTSNMCVEWVYIWPLGALFHLEQFYSRDFSPPQFIFWSCSSKRAPTSTHFLPTE